MSSVHLDIESMRALMAISETGGVTRAAKKLNLSQSAVRNGLGIGLVNNATLEQRSLSRYSSGNRGLIVDRKNLPQPPPIQHVARFASGAATRQMTKLLEL